jgi:hypothetical protein
MPIPEDLRESMRAVAELIQAAKRDPDIFLDGDDVIQIGPICGGRCGDKCRPYEFDYHPEGNRSNRAWRLRLQRLDIEDIAEGWTTEITMCCCASSKCSISNVADNRCDCDYVEDPDFGTFEFPLAIEKLVQRGDVGLRETSTKEDVVAILGTPDQVGGGTVHEKFGYIEPWIKYRRSDCQLHFTFDQSGELRNVTVHDRDWEPGK